MQPTQTTSETSSDPNQPLTADAVYHVSTWTFNVNFGQPVRITLDKDNVFTITKLNKTDGQLGEVMLKVSTSEIKNVYKFYGGIIITANGSKYVIDFRKQLGLVKTMVLGQLTDGIYGWVASAKNHPYEQTNIWMKAFADRNVPTARDHIGKVIGITVVVFFVVIAVLIGAVVIAYNMHAIK